MSTFRADGASSRDDTCEHEYRRFEKCPHCLAAENERLRETLGFYADKRNWRETFGHANVNVDWGNIARAALGEGKG
jgi:hypothetical protein